MNHSIIKMVCLKKALKRMVLVSCMLLLHQALFAQRTQLRVFEAERAVTTSLSLKKAFSSYSAIRIESSQLSAWVHQKTSSFRLNLGKEKQWDIDLQPSGTVSAKYQLNALTESGMQTLNSHPDFLYKGKVRGSSMEEEVRLAIKEGFIYGSIQSDGKEYFIEPLNRFTTAKKDEYIVYEAKDVISSQAFSCGVKDRENILKVEQQQRSLSEQSPLGSICKQIKFISVADYSIYQKFGSDVYAVETALLSNLNLAEGAFSSLNLSPDGSIDVGTDKLQFEVDEVVVSVCKECDILSSTESAPDLGIEMNNWLQKNRPKQGNTIMQFWTHRSLFDLIGRGIGGIAFNSIQCDRPVRQILRYLSDDPAFLRMLVAHEVGHLLGCRHDDEVKPDVKGFIMDSRATTSSTRLSTIADFGGVLYSSQKTIHDFVNFRDCLPDCGDTFCESIKDVSLISYNSPDSITLKWNSTGTVIVKLKVYDSSNYPQTNIKELSSERITLRNLNPCTIYKTELQKKCSATKLGTISSIVFNTSAIVISGKPINIRGDSYDLQIDYTCKNCSLDMYSIKVDKKSFAAEKSGQSQLIVRNLFADGSRHRIDVTKDSATLACANTAFYNAPYYRSNSKTIINADFNSCTLPEGWKDSLLAKSIASAPDARWLIEQKNFFSLSTLRGNFDSSCMIYYNRYNSFGTMYSGAVSLTSPVFDLTKYRDIKLHFDYNFLSGRASWNGAHPSFSIDIHNGNDWKTIFKREADSLPSIRRNIWDSLPSRIFIDLNQYKKENIKLRFIADDGSLANIESGYLFLALDNLQVDGYLENSISNSNVLIYPNPTKSDVFVQFEQPPSVNINYTIIDASGRMVMTGTLSNYRINLSRLSSGMYLLKLYSTDKMYKTVKLIR